MPPTVRRIRPFPANHSIAWAHFSPNFYSTTVTPTAYTAFRGFAHLASGLSVGLSGLAAGMAIGIVGDAGVRATAQQPRLFTGMILILIFAEALGLYGLIVALILSTK